MRCQVLETAHLLCAQAGSDEVGDEGRALHVAAGSALDGPWRFGFAKPLAADSQPFTLQVDRAVGAADLRWAALSVWWLLLGTGAWAWRAWQAQRHARRCAQELLRLGQVGRLNALGEQQLQALALAHEGKEIDGPFRDYVLATQATTRESSRIVRVRMLVQALRGQL